MRRSTLGVLILGGGALLALPFRRTEIPDTSVINDEIGAVKSDPFDDESIRMLVREVTQDVEVPVVYDAHTDYLPPETTQPTRQLPLTYEDLAVPVDRDPFYENRFNAMVGIAKPHTEIDQSRRLAELERVFEQTEYVDQSIAGFAPGSIPPREIPVAGKQWVYQSPISEQPSPDATATTTPPGAHLASSESAAKSTSSPRRSDNSVLAKLPPPDDHETSSEQTRQRLWIKQPD